MSDNRRWLHWRILDSLDWIALAKWKDSVIGKAITGLSLSALFIANLQPLIEEWRIPVEGLGLDRLFAGCLIYVAGSLLFMLAAPPFFSRRGEIYEIVSQMTTLTDWQFFEGQRRMAGNLLRKVQSATGIWKVPRPIESGLKVRVEDAEKIAEGGDFTAVRPGLYQFYLEAEKYSKPVRRLIIALLLGIGTGMIFWPMVKNVLVASCSLLHASCAIVKSL